MTCKSCTWVRSDGLRIVCGITGWAATKRCEAFCYEPGSDEAEDAMEPHK